MAGMGGGGMGAGVGEGGMGMETMGVSDTGGAGGKSGGMGGGGGMGSLLQGLGNQDWTFGQGKATAQKQKDEMTLLQALIGTTRNGGMQVTSGQTPGASPVFPWNPYLVQSLLRSFRG